MKLFIVYFKRCSREGEPLFFISKKKEEEGD